MAQKSLIVSFIISWTSECIGLILDALNLQQIIRYLSTSIDHCVGMNLFAYFGPLTTAFSIQANCLPKYTGEFPPTATFADFLAACRLQNNTFFPSEVIPDFKLKCALLPQCQMDPVDLTCRTYFPELASDGRGEVHFIFFRLVIAVAAIRAAIELLRIACVLASFRRMSNLSVPADLSCCRGASSNKVSTPLFWMAELIGTSLASPLLHFASRAEFIVLLLQREPTPADFVFRALHAGVLTSIPLLAANVWFLLHVTQFGLAPAGWLSLMKSLVLVPRLLFQALRAARGTAAKHQRSGGGGDTLSFGSNSSSALEMGAIGADKVSVVEPAHAGDTVTAERISKE